jgi:hypothetical protein
MQGLDVHDDDDFDDEDPDLSDLNNPDVETLSEPPMLGARPKASDMFGVEADTFGRATSPKLYAAAAQFPTATQFRVWRWENGVPVGLGAIDAEANEDDFVRRFYDAMPKSGEGRFQFRLRPIDIRGQELGKEFTINISEHHATLRQLREMKKREEEERMNGGGYWGHRGPGGDIIVNPGGEGAVGASYAEEMGRMFEQAVEAAESRSAMLQETLEQERERLRVEDKQRVEERVSLAERSAETVQKMTERLMESDRHRSEEAIKAQKEHSGFMLNTLTTVFGQQQEASRQQSDRMREMDQFRMQQDREFFERQRQEMEMQRSRERDESERRRASEREEFERRRRQEGEEWQRRREEERERLGSEARRLEMEAQRREQEMERKRQQEKDEMNLRLEREKLEMETRREAMREERERWRQELEERRRREQQEFERKMALEREERERRERADRERWQRESQEAERKREEERREWERREALRREEMTREGERRREEMALQMKQMEMNAQRDREHAERMSEQGRMERESQREAQLAREKQEREAREAVERDRQRQHEMAMREMEMAKERDREHQERMMQLSKLQQGGGLGGITEMLGMDTADVLAKIFGASEGGEDSGWADAIPKVLGSIAEIGKVALSNQAAAKGGTQQHGRKQVGARKERQIAIQTPEGIRMIPASELARLQSSMTQGVPVPAAVQQPGVDLPTAPFIPPGAEAFDAEFEEAPARRQQVEEAEDNFREAMAESPEMSAYVAGTEVNTLRRAKEAGIKLPDQRKARRAIRKLADKLEKANEDEWFGLTAEAITKDLVIYHYIEAVSVYAALAEAKVPSTLAVRIVKALKESGMIPDSVPYTEEDWQRLQEAQPEGSSESIEAELPPPESPSPEAAPQAQAEADELAARPEPPSWPDTAGEGE